MFSNSQRTYTFRLLITRVYKIRVRRSLITVVPHDNLDKYCFLIQAAFTHPIDFHWKCFLMITEKNKKNDVFQSRRMDLDSRLIEYPCDLIRESRGRKCPVAP